MRSPRTWCCACSVECFADEAKHPPRPTIAPIAHHAEILHENRKKKNDRAVVARVGDSEVLCIACLYETRVSSIIYSMSSLISLSKEDLRTRPLLKLRFTGIRVESKDCW